MVIKQLLDEDFVNYKKPSMFIGFPSCTWKCDRECGKKVCQNGTLATTPNIEIGVDTIINRYINNPITKAIVFGGLEPFDTWSDLFELVSRFRQVSDDDVVIYTGYYKEEIQGYIETIAVFPNIVVKFGRYIPNQKSHYDEVLGVYLASSNQRGEKIS